MFCKGYMDMMYDYSPRLSAQIHYRHYMASRLVACNYALFMCTYCGLFLSFLGHVSLLLLHEWSVDAFFLSGLSSILKRVLKLYGFSIHCMNKNIDVFYARFLFLIAPIRNQGLYCRSSRSFSDTVSQTIKVLGFSGESQAFSQLGSEKHILSNDCNYFDLINDYWSFFLMFIPQD